MLLYTAVPCFRALFMYTINIIAVKLSINHLYIKPPAELGGLLEKGSLLKGGGGLLERGAYLERGTCLERGTY